jgi:uncharacterized DUF497 family protein
MVEGFVGFDWDEGNAEKCRQRIPLEEIEKLFTNSEILIAPDIKHSLEEVRYFAIGVSTQQRHILVVFTFRDKEEGTFIRPISARYMHQKEIEKYEKEFPNNNK